MNFDDLKDQIRDLFNTVWGRVQESSLYHKLREQYESLPTLGQKAIAYGAGFLLVLMILSIPLSYITSANSSIEEFNQSRSLLRDLMRIGRAANVPSPLPPGLAPANMQAQVQALLTEFNLVPEQYLGSTPLGERPAGSLAPNVIHQDGLAVNFSKLNLTQIVDIGLRLQSLSAGVRVTGLNILANSEDNHYFDVTYRIVSFSLPTVEIESEPGGTTGIRARPGVRGNKDEGE